MCCWSLGSTSLTRAAHSVAAAGRCLPPLNTWSRPQLEADDDLEDLDDLDDQLEADDDRLSSASGSLIHPILNVQMLSDHCSITFTSILIFFNT